MIMRAIWTRLAPGIATLALALASGAANADCDFLTGGGFIINNGAKANFGVGGGCKHGTPTWGHLQYIDHGAGLNVHWTSITGYFREGPDTTDSKGRPIGSRGICGTARTNRFGDVDFVVVAKDAGEPGVNDEFDIRLVQNGHTVYTTEFSGFPHKLNNGNGGGGNIQLHKPNPSTTGDFGGSCPAGDAVPGA
jgi:hypothetical protein